MQPLQTLHVTSSIRRKPRTTYKSPSGEEAYPAGPFSATAVSQKIASSSSTPTHFSSKASYTTLQINGISTLPKRKKYPMSPPLPLYHPLGRLALSLPPLDPASVGLPTPVRSDDAVRRSSARARRPAAKLRDVEEESPQPAPATIPIIATPEFREKPSPRKRRTGGGGASKRKRKEIDDGDATYPAKRTRIPRGAANQSPTGDEESESALPVALEVTPTPEPTTDTAEDKKPERRSTRSRGANKRRDSSASDAASSVSISVGAAASSVEGIGISKEPEMVEVDTKSDGGASHISGDGRKEEKEDGELSEEGRPKTPSL
jgi:hypothetical protein